MKEKLRQLLIGRRGMDELSRLLLWMGIAGILLSFVLRRAGSLFGAFGLLCLVCSMTRIFSRNIPMRQAENAALLRWRDRKRREREARKDRWSHRKEYKYFKCPGCGTWLRVPRHKGKIHINCRCGYVLYRRT